MKTLTGLHSVSVKPVAAHMQLTELDYIANSHAARLSIAENYVGLPL
ncbi:MAG: hypothetical protein IV086_16100 [Hyphomonadaceae bacterium]|nr:hypothetical protein [Hyphomonadaceae bacterium]